MARHVPGDTGILAKDIRPHCCGCVIPKGTEIIIRNKATKQPGKARVWQIEELPSHGLHMVKASKVWFEGEPGC